MNTLFEHFSFSNKDFVPRTLLNTAHKFIKCINVSRQSTLSQVRVGRYNRVHLCTVQIQESFILQPWRMQCDISTAPLCTFSLIGTLIYMQRN